MNFDKIILQAINESTDKNIEDKIETLKNNAIKKYIIGKNSQSLELIEKYEISGIIDDFDKKNREWHNIPIVSKNDIDTDSIIINTTSSISPVQVNTNLSKLGFKNIFNLNDLISQDNKLLNRPWFIEEQHKEINNNIKFWSKLNSQFADEQSRIVLSDVTRYRLTANPKYMENYLVKLKDQYFEDFMSYKKEIFVDAGGFDGDTTDEFIRRHPDYQKIYLFEPSKKNLLAAKRRLKNIPNIDFRAVGLSDTKGVLTFNANAGSASAITEKDGENIPVAKLDDELKGMPVTFIKMDLEGWEMKALSGSAITIKKNRPKLAIAVYHAAEDFRKIPDFIMSIHPDYKIYLRHYTQGWSETVMFFL